MQKQNTLVPLAISVLLCTMPLLAKAVSEDAGKISSFTIVNADTDKDIATNPQAGKVVLSKTPRINIRANVQNAGSVVFKNGKTENVAPFAYMGDRYGNYNAWSPKPGTYVITATAYSQKNGIGTKLSEATFTLDVSASGQPVPSKSPTAKPIQTPIATPSKSPTAKPIQTPIATPSKSPTAKPTQTPIATPSKSPTAKPIQTPIATPSKSPTAKPIQTPIATPSKSPTAKPTQTPVATPSKSPTAKPIQTPVATPSKSPTAKPIQTPAATPSKSPTATPATPPVSALPAVFAAQCAACHGVNGSGGIFLALQNYTKTLNEMTTVIRNGKGVMPKYTEQVVSNADIALIYGFFSRKPTATSSPTTIPTATAIKSPTPIQSPTLETTAVDPLKVTCNSASNSMPDIRRLTNFSYAATVEKLTGYKPARESIIKTLPRGSRFGTLNSAISLPVNKEYVNALLNYSNEVVNKMNWASFFSRHTTCRAYSATCNANYATSIFTAALNRQPNADELATLVKALNASQSSGRTYEEAAKITLKTLLTSPFLLYAVVDAPTVDAKTRAQRLSLFLFNHPYEPVVHQAADQGQLNTPKQVETFIRQILAVQKPKAGMEDFFYDWFSLDRLDYSIDLSRLKYPNYNLSVNDALREEFSNYLLHVVTNEKMPFMRVFNDPRAFVSDKTAWIYGNPNILSSKILQNVSTANGRSGLMTHPAVLALSLYVESKSIVDRGVYFNQQIMCREIPFPEAIGTFEDLNLPANASQRAKLALHEKGPCATCHVMLDAPGYALEMFGPIGEFKTADVHGNLLRDEGTFSIDNVERPFGNVKEFSDILANSTEVANCIVKQRLAHALTRSITANDKCEIDRLNNIFSDSNFNFNELTIGIGTSHYFTK